MFNNEFQGGGGQEPKGRTGVSLQKISLWWDPPPLHLPNKVMFVIKQSTPDPGVHLTEVIGNPYTPPEVYNSTLDYSFPLS